MSISVYDPITKKLTQIAGNSNPSSYSIGELEDVDISSPTDGQVLKYDATNEAWVNAEGSDGVDTELSPSSTNAVQNRVVTAALDDKVDKIAGKGLSTNDYTNADKTIVDGVTTALQGKQDTLIAGEGIEIAADGKTISTTSSEYYLEQQVTLSTSDDTTVVFTDAKITADSVLDVYTNKAGLDYKSMSASTGSCTVTFSAVTSSETVTVRLYVM